MTDPTIQPAKPAPVPSVTADQAAILAHAQAAESMIATPGGEGAAATPAPGAPVPPDIGALEENTAILTALVATLTPALPFLQQCYPPPVIKQIATAYTEVEKKHGWNARNFLSCEVQLALVAIPPTISAFMLGREYFRKAVIEQKLPWWIKIFRRKTKAEALPPEAEETKPKSEGKDGRQQ